MAPFHLVRAKARREHFPWISLTNSNIAVVGMDIVFAEEDRTSPSLIAKKLGINKELENYDFDFAKVISTSPVILGYSFNIEDNNSSKNSPQIPAI